MNNLRCPFFSSRTQMPENGRLIMGSVKRRYSKEEFARRGHTLYEKDVRPRLKTDDEGKFAAIDINSGRTNWTATS